MKPEAAKRHLRTMLDSFTPGSVLMLLGEVFAGRSEEARSGGSPITAENYKLAEATVTVVGHGLDAILPKPSMR